MKTRDSFQALSDASLDAVAGGLSINALGAVRQPAGAVGASPFGASPFGASPLGASPLGGLSVGGAGFEPFSNSVINLLNAQDERLNPNQLVATRAGAVTLNTLADQLARGTGGALGFTGDQNHNGIGAEDFVMGRGRDQVLAARLLDNVLDQLHAYADRANVVRGLPVAPLGLPVAAFGSVFRPGMFGGPSMFGFGPGRGYGPMGYGVIDEDDDGPSIFRGNTAGSGVSLPGAGPSGTGPGTPLPITRPIGAGPSAQALERGNLENQLMGIPEWDYAQQAQREQQALERGNRENQLLGIPEWDYAAQAEQENREAVRLIEDGALGPMPSLTERAIQGYNAAPPDQLNPAIPTQEPITPYTTTYQQTSGGDDPEAYAYSGGGSGQYVYEQTSEGYDPEAVGY